MEQQFDEVVDVLVVGSGAAGCAAGASAKRHGAKKVIICEASQKMVGGTTKLAGGGWLWCPNNPFLKKLGVRQDTEELKQLLVDLAYPNQETADPIDLELINSFAEEWPTVLEQIMNEDVMKLRMVDVREEEDGKRVKALLLAKLAKHGESMRKQGITMQNLDQLAELMPSYCAEHELDLCPSGKVLSPDGSTTSLQLEKSAKRLGCEIRMGARVVDLIFDPTGLVVIGAVIASGKGIMTRIRATGGVVFGSGGFAQNSQYLNKYFAQGNTNQVPFGSCAARTNVGDLVTLAEKYDIPLGNMETGWVKQCVLPFKFPQRLGVFFMNGDSYFVCDRSGRRFACDKDFYQQRGMQMKDHSEERRCVFFIFDQRAWDKFEGPVKSLGSAYPNLEGNDDAVVQGTNAQELTTNLAGLLAKVAPGFELAKNFAVNLDQQIDRFNHMAKQGKDTEFGRGDNTAQYCWSITRAKDNSLPNKTMFPVEKSQLRAVVLGLSLLDTKGGPNIDRKGRILNKQNKPLPGLYGAGNAVRSATRNSYPASGVTLSNAVFFGWNAGKDAAERSMSGGASL
ncbi:hypothetical protein BASA81_002761 [Batrachochytrium salamandrivorans]|nr:hypothetical protein BASA81_002761 [Batrachochytrium salamandrivorans]